MLAIEASVCIANVKALALSADFAAFNAAAEALTSIWVVLLSLDRLLSIAFILSTRSTLTASTSAVTKSVGCPERMKSPHVSLTVDRLLLASLWKRKK